MDTLGLDALSEEVLLSLYRTVFAVALVSQCMYTVDGSGSLMSR